MSYSELVLQHAQMVASWPIEEWLACAMSSGDGPNSYTTIKLLHAMLEVKRILEQQAEKDLEKQG